MTPLLAKRRALGVTTDFDPRDRCDGRVLPKDYVGGKWEYYQPCLGDRLRFMVRSGGYVMVRKFRAAVYVVSEKEWAKYPLWAPCPTDERPEEDAR